MPLTPIKFSEMTAATELLGPEIVPVVQDGANRRTTPTGQAIRTGKYIGVQKFGPFTINDDTAQQIVVLYGAASPRTRVSILPNATNRGCGDLWVNAGGAPAVEILFQVGAVINVVAGSGILTGTTGPDGNLNVRSNNGNFFVENRTGLNGTFDIYVFA